MVYFGFYHSVKGYLPQYEVCIVQYARCDVCKAAYVCYNCYTIGNCVSKSTFRQDPKFKKLMLLMLNIYGQAIFAVVIGSAGNYPVLFFFCASSFNQNTEI